MGSEIDKSLKSTLKVIKVRIVADIKQFGQEIVTTFKDSRCAIFVDFTRN